MSESYIFPIQNIFSSNIALDHIGASIRSDEYAYMNIIYNSTLHTQQHIHSAHTRHAFDTAHRRNDTPVLVHVPPSTYALRSGIRVEPTSAQMLNNSFRTRPTPTQPSVARHMHWAKCNLAKVRLDFSRVHCVADFFDQETASTRTYRIRFSLMHTQNIFVHRIGVLSCSGDEAPVGVI